MNRVRPTQAIPGLVFRAGLMIRRLLPKRKSRSFGAVGETEFQKIEKIFVINLDRQPKRWKRLASELSHILDSSGSNLLNLTERISAVDGDLFSRAPDLDSEVDPIYTLGDQLFVEPQPLALPTTFELSSPIRMSRAEVAVARSHIAVWRKIATGIHRYVLVLEDDVWFRPGFTKSIDKSWDEIIVTENEERKIDLLYVSYQEVKHGAPKNFVFEHAFRPDRGLWHLAGYILSQEGARKLLDLLPCRGPIDLWINQKFSVINVVATRRSIISQRRDTRSSNSYSILPSLTTIGAINSEGASLYERRPSEMPVFAFGPPNSGLTSLAMALSMLGYRCCSDLDSLPDDEHERLLNRRGVRAFNAYVNIGTLAARIKDLHEEYPNAKFILTKAEDPLEDRKLMDVFKENFATDVAVLRSDSRNQWQIICEYLRCSPPNCSFPKLEERGQRPRSHLAHSQPRNFARYRSKQDRSPWVIEPSKNWTGIRISRSKENADDFSSKFKTSDDFGVLDESHWVLRSDTFTDNLALFRPSNAEFNCQFGASLTVKEEALGVRDYSAASLTSRKEFLYGKFEAFFKASNVPGVVSGFFLHRNSPRQEIDIEIAGNRPDRLIANVFYNPGDIGANFDYGYRGAPATIDLGFDASKEFHKYAIEWDACGIRWLVDGVVIHERCIWEPTPIPHLPMTLHTNIWVTRSVQFAGRLKRSRLPSSLVLRSVVIQANTIKDSPRELGEKYTR